MREAIELHDSRVTAIVTTGSSARVVIQAYLHRSEGEPGTSPGSGWIQEAVRVFLVGPQGVFDASATAAQLALVGDARYVEEFPGAGTET